MPTLATHTGIVDQSQEDGHDQKETAVRKKKLIIGIAGLALVLAACGGGGDGSSTDPTAAPPGGGAGDIVAGEGIYNGTCAGCHAPNLGGLPGLGKPLAPSEFVLSQSESELAAFVTAGRPTSDPDNTTGVDMPQKGGNPSLDEQDLLDVAAYLKSNN